MKTLLILRHAKSSWKDSGLTDHDRPLNKRGKRDAPRMGLLIRKCGLTPAKIICSTALRARMTAEAVAESCSLQGTIHDQKALYLADPEMIIEVLRHNSESTANPVLVVGHNPGMEDLVQLLAGADELFPTAALAQIELPIDGWDKLGKSTRGELINLWRPRELED